MSLQNRRNRFTQIAKTLHISNKHEFQIVHQNLGMRKTSTRYIPKPLNADQKWVRVSMSKKTVDSSL